MVSPVCQTVFSHSKDVSQATQKMVGNAVAPSTSYPIEDAETGRVKGLLVAEGNPFWINSMLHPTHMDVFKGGIDYLDNKNCTRVFPSEPSATPKVVHDGQVVACAFALHG